MNRNILKGEYYRHFKGHIYEIICIAKQTETLENYVVYQNIETKEIWARELDMFNSLVDNKKYPDIKQKYRFEKIELV